MAEHLNLGDLLSDLTKLLEPFDRRVTAVTTLLAEQKSASVINARAEFIRVTWIKCVDINTQMCRLVTADERLQLTYFTAKKFGKMESKIFQSLDDIAERLATL